MQTVKRQSLIAQVTQQLRNEIAAGRWQVGERIPTEPALCEMTGTARNTVREAVQALVHAGLLERRQGSGTYVIATDEQEVALGDFFAAARRQDLLELREALEVTAAGLAARRRDDDDIAALRRLLAQRNGFWDGADAAESVHSAAVEADAHLHRAIVAASHNEVYLEFYDSLLPALRESIAEHGVGAHRSYEALHVEVVEAVIGGDVDGARAAARQLLTRVGESG
ncbi:MULTISPECIES: FadR/GntR family transcriptional regulator [Gordonia]|uniref:FadR/GntR family transcriptional regulator n=1 Tax=Gordonia TaxID=2053 RepID=UPI00058752C1|nr:MULTISPECIES: FadR/GntR family transcriptional regulator [Gordonia]AUH69909.1 FadR family transcriptional regulator [Gordonia sp. YC-JH1]MBY4569957.1 GntR family transcriptional regulator [Gordonia sihwensis]